MTQAETAVRRTGFTEAQDAAGSSFENRFQRMLGLVCALQSRPRELSVPALAALFRTTTRTIERDLALLRRTGFKLDRWPGEGYELLDRTELPAAVVATVDPLQDARA